MKKLHLHLMNRGGAYAKWHSHPNHHHVHWGAYIATGVVVLLLVLGGIKTWQKTLYDFVTVNFRSRSSVLALEPQTKTVNLNDVFSVDIVLDTADLPINGVDVYSLHYDPTILSVVDANANRNGVQIKPGDIMDINAVNTVDAKTGTIKFSQAASGGTEYSGKGVLATIQFKAVGKGSTYLKYDFVLGSTKDTNVAFGGRDQLTNVVDALYTVK